MRTFSLVLTMVLTCASAEAGSEGTLILFIRGWDGAPLQGWNSQLNGVNAGQSDDDGIVHIRTAAGTYRLDVQDPEDRLRAIYENVRVLPGTTRNLEFQIDTEADDPEIVDAEMIRSLTEHPYPQHIATSNRLRINPTLDLTQGILSASPDVSASNQTPVPEQSYLTVRGSESDNRYHHDNLPSTISETTKASITLLPDRFSSD